MAPVALAMRRQLTCAWPVPEVPEFRPVAHELVTGSKTARSDLGAQQRSLTNHPYRAVIGPSAVPRVARVDVLAAAMAECEARGWPWWEPVRVTGGLLR